MQESTLEIFNRFNILASIADLDNEDYKEVTYDTSGQTLRGNKNKTGPKLGQVCHIKNPVWLLHSLWKAIKQSWV